MLRPLIACALAVLAVLPSVALAEELQLTAGDVYQGFVPAGTACESTDPRVAWVDASGNLNALRAGSTTITAGEQTYDAVVGEYSDGSDIVGNLKIIARYNDAMQFYDGHVYLLFTSYEDGVTIQVDDLYGSYQISDEYYTDIRNNIANGSNHTGSDAQKYFTFTNDNSVTLNRGQLVTIGMYRDFDMSIVDAALASVKNSTIWSGLSNAGKATIADLLMQAIVSTNISTDGLLNRFEAVFAQEGLDGSALLDGVTAGGVCFNRELYNQKLEWDQYENVTYDLDITFNQLNTLVAYLGGNLNNFSVLKNSCATVALRAWNAAVGTRDGVDTAYKLDVTGTGIFSVVDAPKTVRDSIVSRLPGYYLNNATNVEEPGAGYVDDTGCVYVSAPKPVEPLSFAQAGTLQVDESRSNMTSLLAAARDGAFIHYGKDPQQVEVSVDATSLEGVTTINSVSFNINGNAIALDATKPLADGIWFTDEVQNPQEGATYYVTDAEGNALPSEYADGTIYFHTDSLPCSYRITSDNEGVVNQLSTKIVNNNDANVQTEVYCYDGAEKVSLGSKAEVRSGTTIFVKSAFNTLEHQSILINITLNGQSILDSEHYDAQEDAYAVEMPQKFSKLVVTYDKAVLRMKQGNFLQVSTDYVLCIADLAELAVGQEQTLSTNMYWDVVTDPEGAVEFVDEAHSQLVVKKPGTVVISARASGNAGVSVLVCVEAYDSNEEMVTLTYGGENFNVFASANGEESKAVPCSGYKVKKGSEVWVEPVQDDGTVVSSVTFNGKAVASGATFLATEDTNIAVGFRKARIKGMPQDGIVRLASTGDTFQLKVSVSYTGFASLLPVYDPSIRFVSGDPLVEVDETGKITVVGDVPEGGKAVMVTAYAGSSNDSVADACKVIVGDYQGARVVGRLTISARPINKNEFVAHGCVTFTAYEDLDLNVSYYHYYKPTSLYTDLMEDYRDNPQNYASDPALFNNNELGINNRGDYFEELARGAGSEPQTISLAAGEGVTMSNYGYEPSSLTVLKSLTNGDMASSESLQAFVEQVLKYSNGADYDGAAAYDSVVALLSQMYMGTTTTGQNPANGHSDGGLDVNREIYNQFRREDSQMPNNFYTIEITADDFANLQSYVANPDNNYYSFFVKNCATGSVDIWNATLADRPELQLSAAYTGLAQDPESLYFELGKLRLTTGKTYEPGVEGKEEGGGTNIYPRTVRWVGDAAAVTVAPSALELTYNTSAQELVSAGECTHGTMTYSSDGTTFDTQIPTATDAGEYTVYYKALGSEHHPDSEVGSVTVSIAKAPISPKVTIKSWTYGQKAQKPKLEGNLGNGAYYVRYKKNGTEKYVKTVPTDAGNYVVRVTVKESKNYLGGVAKTKLTISKAAAPTKLSAAQKPKAKQGLVANGSAQRLVTAPEALPKGYTKVQYSLDGGKTWSAKIPSGKAAGTYKVDVRYVGDKNHTTFRIDTLKVRIAKAK